MMPRVVVEFLDYASHAFSSFSSSSKFRFELWQIRRQPPSDQLDEPFISRSAYAPPLMHTPSQLSQHEKRRLSLFILCNKLRIIAVELRCTN